MAKDQKRRQASLERKSAKRKAKQQTLRHVTSPSPRAMIRSAADWPLHECLISQGWEKEENLAQIIVARRSPSGTIAAGTFLVDLGLLGVKSAFARVFASPGEYDRELLSRLRETQPLAKADLNLAAKIIREGLAYARKYGFKPDPDYYEASVLLAGADPDASPIHIPLGRDGKPFFFAGPRDNVPQIMAKLEKTAGPGNYDYVIHLSDPAKSLGTEEEWGESHEARGL